MGVAREAVSNILPAEGVILIIECEGGKVFFLDFG